MSGDPFVQGEFEAGEIRPRSLPKQPAVRRKAGSGRWPGTPIHHEHPVWDEVPGEGHDASDRGIPAAINPDCDVTEAFGLVRRTRYRRRGFRGDHLDVEV